MISMKEKPPILYFLFTIIFSIASVSTSYFMKQMIDAPHLNYLLLLGTLLIITNLLEPLQRYSKMSRIHNEKATDQLTIIGKIKKIPYCIIETEAFSTVTNKLKNLTDMREKSIDSKARLSGSAFEIVGLIIIIRLQCDLISLCVIMSSILCFSFFSILVNRKIADLMYDYWSKYIQNTRKYQYVSEVLSNKEYVEDRKVFQYDSYFVDKFSVEFDTAQQNNKELGKTRIRLEMVNDAIYFGFIITIVLLLLTIYNKEMISLGMFISMSTLIPGAFERLCTNIQSGNDIKQYRKLKAEYNTYMHSEPLSVKQGAADVKPDVAINISNLSFQYQTGKRFIINRLNLVIEKGMKCAIVGENGVGKTTLVKLIAGLYEPTEGTVNTTDEPAVIFQDYNRYPLTLLQNILLADSSHVSDEIWQSCDLDNIENKLSNRRDTELTNLKEGGEDLSGGEWQRIALARAINLDKQIYILDEPTASLDPIAEVEFYNKYFGLLNSKTVLLITHRLGYTKNMDKIFVLGNDGNVVEEGNHLELMRANGLYHMMYMEQKKMYE